MLSVKSQIHHEAAWWKHIWSDNPKHRLALVRAADRNFPYRKSEQKETCFALIIDAMLERERKFIPRVGLAVDRRTLQHVGEVFKEDNIKTLMCFICGWKHIYHHGFDKYGESISKGRIDYRLNTGRILDEVLRGRCDDPNENKKRSQAHMYNLSYARFIEKFGPAVQEDQ